MAKKYKSFVLSMNHAVYICAFLACLVPRYIPVFKLHLGINISYYTIATIVIWVFSTRRVVIQNRIEYSFFFLWAAFIVISVWRAEKIGVWAYYFDWILTAILFQQIVFSHRDDRTIDYILRAMTDALFLHLLMGIYEVTTHSYLFETGGISGRLYGRVAIGMFHNLNDYATFVTTMLPLAIYRFMQSRKLLAKLYCSFLSVSSLYFLIVSESRGAILTLIVFICGGIYMFARRKSRNRLIVFGALLVFAIVLISDIGGGRTFLTNLIRNNWIDVNGRSDSARINLIKNGMYFLKRTYGFGVGAGNLTKWLTERSIYDIGHLALLHNWYVEVLVTFGVLFFIVYLYFHGKIMYRLFSKRYGKNRLKTMFFLSFVCFSIVSISSSSNVYSEWVWMYLVVVAMFSVSLEKTDSVGKQMKLLL